MCKTTAAEKKEIDHKIAKFVYATKNGFNVVNNQRFKDMIDALRPGYKAPNRDEIENDLLDTIYEEEKENVVSKLENQMVSLSVDGWSKVRNEPIVVSWVVDEVGKSYLVNTVDTSENHHFAEYLEEVIAGAIKKAKSEFKCIVGSVVSDNAHDMGRYLSDRNEDIICYSCSKHVLKLLAKDFKNSSVTGPIETVVKYFQNNHFARTKFNEMQTGKNLGSPNRWNTMCHCLKSYLDNWCTFLKICKDFKDDIELDIKKIVKNVDVKRNAEDLLALLKPIADTLTQIEGNLSNRCYKQFRKIQT